ncbi:metal ABC transporter substrate-binding protein [Leptolyngbya sp. FACHB-261]|uniref:metal ABC transporter substrate-binding protein n=1 Tax=Leptolyngbya sp. FACHB-261 TaxID=2692806 RepID=UPI001687CBB6|nr:metal ABC transporter substrate-binding protein [Leptolyngbya sp. FACHB-261]MBD2100162.1 zinc ABC transporter substrate-binding protein [Leptolyngbya sp. FACHB-261]
MIRFKGLLRLLSCCLLGLILWGTTPAAQSSEIHSEIIHSKINSGTIKVVATTSDLQSLVEAVGGTRVAASSIALPAQDPHAFEPRLANLQQLKGANLVVKIGLDHDLWFDKLLQETGNLELQRGGKGYVDASLGVPLLEVRSTTFAPTAGHNHGAGNPHYWLDPLNAQTMTGAIVEGLVKIDPDYADFYEANRTAFLLELDAKLTNWEQQLAPFQGIPVIAYHNSWPYLARRFRLKIIDYVEPKPGVPASPTHLAALIREIKAEHVSLVIKEPYEPEQIPKLLSKKTGASVVTLVSSVGALPAVEDYFALFDYNVRTLAQAFSQNLHDG